MVNIRAFRSLLLAVITVAPVAFAQWQPAEAPLMTRWAKDVSPGNVLPEYPRPQLVRKSWVNLNGLWEYALRPKSDAVPGEYDGEILVPFPIESALSGVMKRVGADQRLWYRRSFSQPVTSEGERVLLHFGGVDWQSRVWLNGALLGKHEGGYDPFVFDITEALRDGRNQELVVSVWDPTDSGPQPRGKQTRKPKGIWYTPVTGIWQTVWLETVPAAYIRGLTLTPDVSAKTLSVTVTAEGAGDGATVWARAFEGDEEVSSVEGAPGAVLRLPLKRPKLWSPDAPFLYRLDVGLHDATSGARDQVGSYFAMRSIALETGANGRTRIALNGKPLFHIGLLDQGWWPDGLYTAPTDEALAYDIRVTKQLGFNMARKHVKVEPDRWYYHCDRLGLLVWQDMPNGDQAVGPGRDDLKRTSESAAIFHKEYSALIDHLYNHPCIAVWVPFNEGWGQFDTNEIVKWTQSRDPTRLVDGPSGWTDRGVGDLYDMHRYPGPGMRTPEPGRASVLGEFGGLGYPVAGHTWFEKQNWGYRTYTTDAQLWENFQITLNRLPALVKRGLAAAVYTQTTDVESEVNGLMTYDREVVKLDAAQVSKVIRKVSGR